MGHAAGAATMSLPVSTALSVRGLCWRLIQLARPYGTFQPEQVAAWLQEHYGRAVMAAMLVQGDGTVGAQLMALAQNGYWAGDTLIVLTTMARMGDVVAALRYRLGATTVGVLAGSEASAFLTPGHPQAFSEMAVVRATWYDDTE